jgi:uncharacterized membrane protein YkoI
MRTRTWWLAAMALSVAAPALAGDCPAAVMSAVERAQPKSKALSCKSEKEKGSTLYEVKVQTMDGKKLEMDVSPEGEILVTEEHIPLSAVPSAAMTSLEKKFAGARVSDAERLTAKDGEVSFELTFKAGGKEHEITVTEAGEILSVDDEDAAAAPHDNG